MNQGSQGPTRRGTRRKTPSGFRELLYALLTHADRAHTTGEALELICRSLHAFSGADCISLRLEDRERTLVCRTCRGDDGEPHSSLEVRRRDDLRTAPSPFVPDVIVDAIRSGGITAPTRSFARGGSFWIGDTARPVLLRPSQHDTDAVETVIIGGEFASLAVVLVPVVEQAPGLLVFGSKRRDFFSAEDVQHYETAAATLGVALANRDAQRSLGARVRELSCLYEIAKLAQQPGMSLEELLGRIVALLPPAWREPDRTAARIVLDGRSFVTAGFRDVPGKRSARIASDDTVRGVIEVVTAAAEPAVDASADGSEERALIDAVATTIGGLVAHHEAQWALRERVKELTCLYGIAKVASTPGLTIDEILSRIVLLLPPGWQYPDITEARIGLDGRSCETPGFTGSPFRQSADLRVNDVARGVVEVAYVEATPTLHEGPFLAEERSLIDEIARQIGLVVERYEADEETARLEQQLRHADRLATVGQLSAGVAHELNEPLGGVLGFAELLRTSPGLPPQAVRDADRIIQAALHAREVIRKLMVFTRQVPTAKTECDLNKIIAEGLYFLESRCAREGVLLVRQLDTGLPALMADPAQIHQVVVNLVVNAIQAMPQGGTLTIETRAMPDGAALIVRDVGVGMSPDVQQQLFTPFFTTKDVGQGTGLGLAMVHGIIKAHGGSVHVESTPGQGSSFEVRLPCGGHAAGRGG